MNFLLRFHQSTSQFDARISDWGGSLLGLGLRLFISWQFFKAGLTKIDDWSTTLALFENEYQVPLLPANLAAAMGTAGELILPVLLAIGLFSRPAAVGLLAVNLMAVISYPALFAFDCPAAINDHLYWGLLLLVLAVYGPGKIAVDAWLDSVGRVSQRRNTP